MLALRLITVLLVGVAWALSLAHALEMPGKLRLDEATYRAVQGIYYPGFTWAGICEVAAIVATLVLWWVGTSDRRTSRLVLISFAGMVAMQAVYWLVVHPVNQHWLTGQALDDASQRFFAAGSGAAPTDWRAMQARWEYGHLARACLTTVALVALLLAVLRRRA